MSELRGIYNILATPFESNGKIDIWSLRNLVEFQMDCGVAGLTILGVLGEAAKLTVEERATVLREVVSVTRGLIPVVVGASHSEDEVCLEICRNAEREGAAGVMVAPPGRYAGQDELQLVNYYTKLANGIEIPIVVQDFPPVNGVFMSAATIGTIASELPSARYLKLEVPPLMRKIVEILDINRDVVIFGGLGGMFLLEELRSGAAGTMTGFAFSEILIAVERAFREGNYELAESIFDRYLPLIRYENQPLINLTLRKYILYLRGAIKYPAPREPYEPLGKEAEEEVSWLFKRVGIENPSEIIRQEIMEV